jgi:hypothetical protein
LGTTITGADLKNKAKIALDLSKKARSVKVYIRITEENEGVGRNILYSVKIIRLAFTSISENLFYIV